MTPTPSPRIGRLLGAGVLTAMAALLVLLGSVLSMNVISESLSAAAGVVFFAASLFYLRQAYLMINAAPETPNPSRSLP
ncbi:MAG: hypothetical protein WAN87_08400 [Thermoplasmata archaeon]